MRVCGVEGRSRIERGEGFSLSLGLGAGDGAGEGRGAFWSSPANPFRAGLA